MSKASVTPAVWPSWLQGITAACYLVTVVINGASNAASKPFGGSTNADISNAHRTAFTPAGYAFSIWGVIYTFGAMFAIWQLLPAQRAFAQARVGVWLPINFVANALWIIAFTNEWGAVWVSVGIIFLGILAPLIVTYIKMEVGNHARVISAWELVCAHHFVSIYMGWTSVACIANVAVAGTPKFGVADWGWSASNWSILMQTVASVLALTALALKQDYMFAAPIAWALFAIASQQKSELFPGDSRVVSCAYALGSIVAVAAAAAAALRVFWWQTKRTPTFARVGDSKGAVGEVVSNEEGAEVRRMMNPVALLGETAPARSV